ncbi:DUF2637 domain-containing protein [Pseudonocardia sp.]|uniref:DUF2637 domain-containing protein n=1 Tax=Pseudonocardia sp. TaxID=60912 RepID=UPI003D0B4080
MSARRVLYVLLLVVAAAAAVLSFAALRDLALVCGFAPRLGWLLPVVVDAGAAAGSLVWLGGWATGAARRFARALALALLALSVAANALGHGLAAFGLAPAWWVVVIVSAVAPAVLGAVVHLAVLVGRPHPDMSTAAHEDDQGDEATKEIVDWWRDAPPAEPAARVDPGRRAAELIAAGAGRRRLSRELGMTEYEARQLLARTRTPNGDTPDPATTEAAIRDAATPEVAGPAAADAGLARTSQHFNGSTPIERTS